METLHKLFSSFKFQVTFVTTGLVLIAAICVGGISLLITEAEMREVLAQQESSLIASIAAQIDTDLEEKQQLLAAVAEEARGHNLAPVQLQQLLEEHSTLRNEFFNVTAFDAHGELIANLNNRVLTKLNIKERPYFRSTLRSRDSEISAPFKSVISGKPVVVITQPLIDSAGNIISVVVGAIDLTRPTFGGRLQTPTMSQGYIFIVNDDGWIIHHPRKSFLLQQNVLEPEIADAINATSEGARDDLVDNGTPVLLTHVHLRHANWTIAGSYPIRSAFAPMMAVRARVLASVTLFVAMAALFSWLLVATLLRPLRRLHADVVRFDEDKLQAEVFNVKRNDEFGVLSRAIFRLQRHREAAEQALYIQAHTDVLTGVNNRRMFEQFLPLAIARTQRGGSFLAVAFLDIDKFKNINDTYGHAAGDAVLVEFAKRISGAVRATDTVARLAGDEFVIVFERLKTVDEAHALGQKIIAAMSKQFVFAGHKLPVTTSVGIAVSVGRAPSTELMAAADDAVYVVKAAGRNGYAINLVDCDLSLVTVPGVHKHGLSRPAVQVTQVEARTTGEVGIGGDGGVICQAIHIYSPSKTFRFA